MPRFEWDPDKAAENLANHGVSFEEAETVFEDPLGDFFFDDFADEDRWIRIGRSAQNNLLRVADTERGDAIRIISARKLEPHEREAYAEGW